jgi:uncharacterized membrane protein
MDTLTVVAARVGRFFVAISMAAFGIQFLLLAPVVHTLSNAWPAVIPGQPWGYLVGLFLIAAGGAIVCNLQARAAAILLGTTILLWAVLRHLPLLAGHLRDGGIWTNAGKAFAMSGCAFLAAGPAPVETGRALAVLVERLGRIRPLARFFLGVPMVIFGIEHFIYEQFVESLVPNWIPWHAFWTYFAAVALIAGGSGMILKIRARLAAAMSGLMIFLWVLMLHLPRAAAAWHDTNEWTSVFQALAWSGAALILAENLRSERQSLPPAARSAT